MSGQSVTDVVQWMKATLGMGLAAITNFLRLLYDVLKSMGANQAIIFATIARFGGGKVVHKEHKFMSHFAAAQLGTAARVEKNRALDVITSVGTVGGAVQSLAQGLNPLAPVIDLIGVGANAAGIVNERYRERGLLESVPLVLPVFLSLMCSLTSLSSS